MTDRIITWDVYRDCERHLFVKGKAVKISSALEIL